MQVFLQQLVNGLSSGAIYALIAVGYTMVYGVLRLINFAHGDVFMIGAMGGLYAARWIHLDGSMTWPKLVLVALAAMVICALLGFVIEFFCYRPMRNQPRINTLITAIGISLFLEYGGQRVFGPTPQAFPIPDSAGKTVFSLGNVPISQIDLVIMVATVSLMLLLTYIVLKTRTGLALRAVSFRFDTSSLMGINVNRIISFTFILGSILAGIGGVLYAVKYPTVNPLMGLVPGVKAFIAAVLGGIGNIAGAVVGGLLLGLIEALISGYLPNGSQYRDGVAFVILIVVLLIKPTGLFGKHVIEKV